MVLRCNQSEAQMPRELASLLLLWPQISKRRCRQSSDQGACTHMSGPQGPRDVKKGHGGRVKTTVYSLGTKRGCGCAQRDQRLSRPAGPRRHWPPVLGSRATGGSCRRPGPPQLGVSLGRCWQWGQGVQGPGLHWAPEGGLQGHGCPPERPCGVPCCLCPRTCSLGPAAAQKAQPLVHSSYPRGAHLQQPQGCLGRWGVQGRPGWLLGPDAGAHLPARSERCGRR